MGRQIKTITMAENKKSVLLYCDIIHTVEELSDTQAGKLFKHYLRYINDLDPAAPDKITQIVFEPIKQNLKRDLKKWEQTKLKKSEGGKKGMDKRWGNIDEQPITSSNIVKDVITSSNIVKEVITPITVTATATATVTDNVTVNVISKQQVVEFLRSAGLPSDRVEYEANELMKVYNGKGIKNLKALCNTWAENVRTQQIMPSPEKNMNHFI